MFKFKSYKVFIQIVFKHVKLYRDFKKLGDNL